MVNPNQEGVAHAPGTDTIMANNPCPKCGTDKWWWRDENGCSVCTPEPPERK